MRSTLPLQIQGNIVRDLEVRFEGGRAVEVRASSGEERHARGVNHSSIHTDFMIGSNELEVDGVSASGEAVPILRNGDWLL